MLDRKLNASPVKSLIVYPEGVLQQQPGDNAAPSFRGLCIYTHGHLPVSLWHLRLYACASACMGMGMGMGMCMCMYVMLALLRQQL